MREFLRFSARDVAFVKLRLLSLFLASAGLVAVTLLGGSAGGIGFALAVYVTGILLFAEPHALTSPITALYVALAVMSSGAAMVEGGYVPALIFGIMFADVYIYGTSAQEHDSVGLIAIFALVVGFAFDVITGSYGVAVAIPIIIASGILHWIISSVPQGSKILVVG